MESFKPSAYTPFTRRFTDERARDLGDLRSLYAEVRRLHQRSRFRVEDAPAKVGLDLYVRYARKYPEEVMTPLGQLLSGLVRLESPIFEFPELPMDGRYLSLKEQLDLQRFLTAKRFFHTHEDQVIAEFEAGLERLFEVLTDGLPDSMEPSPFSVPLMTVLADPKHLIDRLYHALCDDRLLALGLFAEVREAMYVNLCHASNVIPNSEHKRPLKHAMDRDEPLQELVNIYLTNTYFDWYLQSPIPLSIPYETRFSHMHVVGGSGAGKTQLLQSLILHDLKSDDPPALVIVDSQTDLIGKLSHLALFDPDTGPLRNRLLLITPRDTKYPPALNIFDVNRSRHGDYDEATKEQVTAGVIQTFDYLFGGLLGADLTAKQGVFFRFVARLMLALPETMGRPATILDLIALMDDPTPYMDSIARLPDIQRAFFERDFPSKTFAQTREQIRYRLNAILENPTLARLFTSPKTKIDLFEELNRGSIILVDTAKDFLKSASGSFGRIFISLVLQAILERAAIPEHQRKPAFLIVDEAAAYFDSNIDDLLTEARKYKLGCVFAHQFLDQCTSALRSSLAANTAIKMASGVSTYDARALAPDMRTTSEFILTQPKLQFASYIRGVAPQAVSIAIPPGALESEPRLSQQAYEDLRELNRARVSLPTNVPDDGFTIYADGRADDGLNWQKPDDPTDPSEW